MANISPENKVIKNKIIIDFCVKHIVQYNYKNSKAMFLLYNKLN
jgi:hypothetical protein